MSRQDSMFYLSVAALIEFAAALGRQKEKMEAPPVSLGMKLLKATILPLTTLHSCYEATPIAQYASLPALVMYMLLAAALAWGVSRYLDSDPYLFNGGKLGRVEKQSVYVQAKLAKKKQ